MNGGISYKRGNVVYYLSDDQIVFIKFGIRYVITPKNIRAQADVDRIKLVSFLIANGELWSVPDVLSELDSCYSIIASTSLGGYR